MYHRLVRFNILEKLTREGTGQGISVFLECRELLYSLPGPAASVNIKYLSPYRSRCSVIVEIMVGNKNLKKHNRTFDQRSRGDSNAQSLVNSPPAK